MDAFYTPDLWVRFNHLELEYDNKFYDPAFWCRQAEHYATWGYR